MGDKATAKKLILFDIDGTLITDSGASREAFAEALRETYEFTNPLDSYDFSGQTDPQIAHMVLGDAGFAVNQIDDKLPRFWSLYLTEMSRRVSPERVRALAGAHHLLSRLRQVPRFTLALLTGNIEQGARIKLAPPDLNGFFAFGAFGSDSARREELAPVACRRAAAIHIFLGSDVVIIGDSIFEVRCGVPHGATTIAVASGRTSLATLEAENPSFLFTSLEDSDAIIDAIG